MVRDEIIEEFLEDLSSKNPVPGGGGASALAGAFGTALGQMVCNLSAGKKSCREFEADLSADLERLEILHESFLRLADKDEQVFLPLKRAYSLPKNTPDEIRIKEAVMEQALLDATNVPISVMETALGALELLRDIAPKGHKLVISDAGVGASFLRTALDGASYNVFVNVQMMKNREKAERLKEHSKSLLRQGNAIADETESIVKSRLS